MGIQGNLVTDGTFETYTGSGNTTDFTNWAETRTNGSGTATVQAYTTQKRFGACSCNLKTTSNDGVASVTSSAYITITPTLHYVLRFSHWKVGGANSCKIKIKQYNSSSADLSDDIVITPTGSAAWGLSQTIIHAAGDGGNDFHAQCAKAKIICTVDTTTADWAVDGVSLAISDGDTAAGFGTKLFVNGYEVAEVTTISGPSMSADTIDVTSHDSPSMFREFLAGAKDGGEVTFDGNLVAADTTGQIVMEDDLVDGTRRTFYLIFPGAFAEWTFTGDVSGWSTTSPYDDKMGFSATVKVTGVPTLSMAA